jgi:hypothetical protein
VLKWSSARQSMRLGSLLLGSTISLSLFIEAGGFALFLA